MKKRETIKKAWSWLFISAFVIAIDQITKQLVVHFISDQTGTIDVLPFLNIILTTNSGASFGFLDQASGWHVYFLVLVSLFISFILIRWLVHLPKTAWQTALPVSLVLGGALGNLIDRVHYGLVIDFIDFHLGDWHYATFNIADAAVCVGVIWLVAEIGRAHV